MKCLSRLPRHGEPATLLINDAGQIDRVRVRLGQPHGHRARVIMSSSVCGAELRPGRGPCWKATCGLRGRTGIQRDGSEEVGTTHSDGPLTAPVRSPADGLSDVRSGRIVKWQWCLPRKRDLTVWEVSWQKMVIYVTLS